MNAARFLTKKIMVLSTILWIITKSFPKKGIFPRNRSSILKADPKSFASGGLEAKGLLPISNQVAPLES